MTFWQELGLAEVILGDISAVANGQPVSTSQKVGNATVSVSVKVLTDTTGYQTLSGSFLPILLTVFQDATALAAGAPLQIAEKIGNTWYGYSITLTSG